MVTETLVEPIIESGREIIAQFQADGHPLVAAFWLKAFEDENWRLYLVTRTMTKDGPKKSYYDLYASWSKLENPFVSYADVKIIDVSDPIAQSVAQLIQRYEGRLDTWFGPRTLGSLTAEKLFVYSLT